MNKKAIVGSKMIINNQVLEQHVLIFTDLIESILSMEDYIVQRDAYDEIQFEGYLLPGFIDIHIHGAVGHDVMDASKEALEHISNALVQTGTTAFLATTMTMAQAEIEQALSSVRDFMSEQKQALGKQSVGAEILGVHLEGPFINPVYKGAQDPKHIQVPSLSWIAPYLDVIKMITYAPEMDPDFEFAKAMQPYDVVLSIGHSGSDYETAIEAFSHGVSHVTHCFNACSGLHHRKPGVVGAALARPFTIDLIADGIHVHPDFMAAFIQIKGVEQTILITDAMRAALMPDGNYSLGGQTVVLKDNACRLVDGTLAGSVLTTMKAFNNLLNKEGLTRLHLVQMLSENPAKKLGLYDQMGSLDIGKRANLVLMNEDGSIHNVFVSGQLNQRKDTI